MESVYGYILLGGLGLVVAHYFWKKVSIAVKKEQQFLREYNTILQSPLYKVQRNNQQ